ncbi:MAG: hypothetical protein ACUZ8H_05440 [Candidatus Anammoxibacter sp.]
MIMHKTKHAVREEYSLKFIFTCFIIFCLYNFGSWYSNNLKKSMNDAFTESIFELNEMARIFQKADKLTLEITER